MHSALDSLALEHPALPDHLRRIRRFDRYSPLLMVRTEKGGRVVPLRLMPAQERIGREAGTHPRVLILKPRRLGITTMYLGRAMHGIQTRHYWHALMTAHREVDSTKIFKGANIMYGKLPQGLRHARSRSHRREVEYPLMGSMLSVGTAGGAGAGRSDTLQFVHMTEVARYRGDAEDFISGVLEAAREGVVTGESTAAGAGGWFYDTWVENIDADDDAAWRCIFAPWHADHRNRVAMTEDEIRDWREDPEGEPWAYEHRLTMGQVEWYRRKKRLLKRKMLSEYPNSWLEAFSVSGMHLFDQENVQRAALEAKHAVPLERLDVPQGLRPVRGRGLLVWKRPEPGRKYVQGADPTDGTPHGDPAYSSIHELHSGEQIARLHGRWSPRVFAKYLAAIGRWYNNAFTVVELNHRECAQRLRDDERYRYVFYRRKKNKERERDPGWWMDGQNRVAMLDHFVDAFEGEEDADGVGSGWLLLRDAVVFGEMTTFEDQGNGKYAANSGKHDDSIIAVGLALQGRNERLRGGRVREA